MSNTVLVAQEKEKESQLVIVQEVTLKIQQLKSVYLVNILVPLVSKENPNVSIVQSMSTENS
jgi:hypothetical protein